MTNGDNVGGNLQAPRKKTNEIVLCDPGGLPKRNQGREQPEYVVGTPPKWCGATLRGQGGEQSRPRPQKPRYEDGAERVSRRRETGD